MSKTLLIVEDEFIVANDLRLILTGAGYNVTGIAASADESAEMIARNKPDMVLLDIRLERNSSGIEIAKELRAENIPFVFLSANSSQKILEEAKATDPYGFLVKPFRKKDLLVTLDIAWYRHEQSTQSKLRQEALLEDKLKKASSEAISVDQRILKIVRQLQSSIPFDLFISAYKETVSNPSIDKGYLRIGFDEYQFISKKELLIITGMKESEVPADPGIAEAGETGISRGGTEKQEVVSTLSGLMTQAFNLQSYLSLTVNLSDGRSVQYFFYSRQGNIYTDDHVALLSRLNDCLTEVAERLYSNAAASLLALPDNSGQLLHQEVNDVRFKSIIGSHHLLLSALDLTAQVAPYNTSVLIFGESGTGKEKVAQLIHTLSGREKEPFVKVNCGAIPPTLIESELFGHQKGAFTGASEKRKGKFEQAQGGTIFLDEIGELPLAMQVKLLRVLQEKEIEYVGGSSPIKVNVRVVAATNKNLEQEVAQGRFRLDLYYRLNAFPITLPPLRERKSDIYALALYFADKFCREFNKPFHGISPSMADELAAYDWPGNIRELGNILEQSVILNDGKSKLELKRVLARIEEKEVGNGLTNSFEDIKQIQRETERSYMISVLKKVKGRIRGVKGAAELLNIKPTTLEAKIAKLNITKEDISDDQHAY
ncbi:MAG: sigma 54-interacting transcriptional regulator [Chitinophagaceae bacterium]